MVFSLNKPVLKNNHKLIKLKAVFLQQNTIMLSLFLQFKWSINSYSTWPKFSLVKWDNRRWFCSRQGTGRCSQPLTKPSFITTPQVFAWSSGRGRLLWHAQFKNSSFDPHWERDIQTQGHRITLQCLRAESMLEHLFSGHQESFTSSLWPPLWALLSHLIGYKVHFSHKETRVVTWKYIFLKRHFWHPDKGHLHMPALLLKPQILQCSNDVKICFHALETCLLGILVRLLQNEKYYLQNSLRS